MFKLPWFMDRPILIGFLTLLVTSVWGVLWALHRRQCPPVLAFLDGLLSRLSMGCGSTDDFRRRQANYLLAMLVLFLAMALFCFAVAIGIVENGDH